GKRPNGKEIAMIVSKVCKKIKNDWSQTQILFRGDSHYSAPEVHDLCDVSDHRV
ncbi:IS1380 family transposase, partial [candidate division KSB1 bacterium]|nr:IS1380 family transposase [candidate division KSB1 bacterium]